MIRLHQFPPALGLPNASPFCLKLETWLRMAGLAYENVHSTASFRAPKGKFPYVVDDGTTVADSGLAIAWLARRHAVALDAGLDDHQRATALLLQRTIEEHLYWCVAWFRWIDDSGWPLTREGFFGGMPAPLNRLVPPIARRGIRAQLHGAGIGRHGRDEIAAMALDDLRAISVQLGDQPFLVGDAPSTIDACGYGFLANIYDVPVENPIKDGAQAFGNLKAYVARMRERYWS